MRPLLILRHAQSEWNALGRWQGQADPALSPGGRDQALAAARRIAADERYTGFDMVFSSDLRRASETAEIVAGELALDTTCSIDAGLREYDVGEWSGLTFAEIEAAWPGAVARFSADLRFVPPGGEDRIAFDRRVREAAGRIAALAAEAGAGGVLVVAHGGVLRSVARQSGMTDHRVNHLCGYWGRWGRGQLFPSEPVDLLVPAGQATEAL